MASASFLDELGTAPRPRFVPCLETLAPRLEGRTFAEVTSDGALWASAVERLAELVGADAVAIGWDPSVVAEACAAEPSGERPPGAYARLAGRAGALLEAVRRLGATPRGRRRRFVAVPAPASLAARAFGREPDRPDLDRVRPVLIALVEEICRTRPDALVLVESGDAAAGAPEVRRLYGTVRNLAAHYGVATALQSEGYREVGAAGAAAAALRIEHWMIGADAAGLAPEPAAAVRAAAGFRSVAVPLPLDAADSARGAVEAALAAAGSSLVYFTTAGPVPAGTDIGTLREVAAAIRGA